MTLDRALILMPEPLNWILDGKKTWDVRSQSTPVRGRIALLERGTRRIVGTCTLTDCIPITLDEYVANHAKMNRTRAELESWRHKQPAMQYAWVLADVQRLPASIAFTSPKDQIVWATLPPEIVQQLG